MQEAGEPLKLDFAKADYGPYAENLRHVLRRIDGHFVSGYADGGDSPTKSIEPLPEAMVAAESYLAGLPETRARFERVSSLVEGFESVFGLELLATVHWVATREGAASSQDAVRLVHAWNERKKRFLPEQIAIAWDILAAKGWLRAA
jgi:hypothetical protein